MLLNMLNDLAEAMKASDGKKNCLILCTLGLVPGLSGRRLVQDFQHRPFPPTNFCEDSALSVLIDYLFLLHPP